MELGGWLARRNGRQKYIYMCSTAAQTPRIVFFSLFTLMLFHGLLYIYLSLWFAVYGQLIDHVSSNLKTPFFPRRKSSFLLLPLQSVSRQCTNIVACVQNPGLYYTLPNKQAYCFYLLDTHTRTKFDLAHYHEPMRIISSVPPLAFSLLSPPPGEKRGIIRENIGLDRKWLEFSFFLFKKKTNPIFVLFFSLNLPLQNSLYDQLFFFKFFIVTKLDTAPRLIMARSVEGLARCVNFI